MRVVEVVSFTTVGQDQYLRGSKKRQKLTHQREKNVILSVSITPKSEPP